MDINLRLYVPVVILQLITKASPDCPSMRILHCPERLKRQKYDALFPISINYRHQSGHAQIKHLIWQCNASLLMNQNDFTQSQSPEANISVKIICFSPPLLISNLHNSENEDNIGYLVTLWKYDRDNRSNKSTVNSCVWYLACVLKSNPNPYS